MDNDSSPAKKPKKRQPRLRRGIRTTAINIRMNREALARIDAEAERAGLTRTAWLHVAALEKLQKL